MKLTMGVKMKNADIPTRNTIINTVECKLTKVESWAADNATGRARADALISRMKTERAPCLLGFVVQTIVGPRGQYGGAEVGFFQRLSELLIS
jgi:hypothetical protein